MTLLREEAMDQHNTIADTFMQVGSHFGFHLTMKKENELHEGDMIEKDLCISVGKQLPFFMIFRG